LKAWLLNLLRGTPAPLLPARPLVELDAPALEEAPEWLPEDRGTLLQFLRSDSGRRLLSTLRVHEEILKAQACDETEKRVDHARGKAVGYRSALASLIVLSAPPPPSVETAAKSDSGADDLRKQLSHG